MFFKDTNNLSVVHTTASPCVHYAACIHHLCCDPTVSAVPFTVTSCVCLQSYHDPEEEEDVHLASVIAAGASVTSGHDVSQPEEEKQSDGEGLEGEMKEDLPEQPPPVEDKPKEGKDRFFQLRSFR